ncbi:hypothetical protein [Vibrio sp. 1CM23M]|uniref:hypothetical protein n=1 Tax=Vibrio sp. 1CM23M TaxID=2929164 RepID=UPI0020C16B40|nr:hypothetical protein [Vibrio sp. 1CM23M]MCK8072475.1 hypothetical protein [Vibrio sp. 1CM23M]
MTKKTSYRDSLPVLARKALDKAEPRQYIAIEPELMSRLTKNKVLFNAMTLLMQLKPNQRIQYVTLEELQHKQIFLKLGLIKETKKVGADRFVVPKTSAYCGID